MQKAILFGLLLLLPGPISAQAGQGSESSPARAGGSAAALMKLGSVAGSNRVMIGGWAGLVFGERFLLAGGGMGLTRDVELPGSGLSTGFDLGFGYGGVFLKYWEELEHDLTGGIGILLGAGHAEIRDRLIGNELGADNFLVLEPEASLSYRLFNQVSLEGATGYRFVSGVEDLPTVEGGDLRGFTGTLLLRVGGR